ncbi:MAG: ATP-binding cassette domain-containing protein [Deltaproteobacteria bacterium]|nr:ATP-binding cassette domain-containing protein [Deltaproteobacteria bacterium]
MEKQAPDLRVDGLTVRYGPDLILKDVSFTVFKSEIFAILGGSGSGKSTIMRHAIGLERPENGRIWIKGYEITGADETAFFATLKNIGVLFQGSALIGSMTVGENVALPITEFTGLPRDAVTAMVRVKLGLVGLDCYENHLPSEISGGMKKRAGLARALALNPGILFLDEPSAGLDPVTASEIDELILRINKRLGTTIIIVTHDLGSIFTVAGRAIMIDKSTLGIIAEGSPDDLKEKSTNPVVKGFFMRKAIATS